MGTCKCGCGGKIVFKPHHRWYGVPKFIQGHNDAGGRFKKGKKHPNYGKHLPETITQKISEAHKGIKFSEEHRKNLSESHWKGGCEGYYHMQARKIVEKLTGIKPSKELVVHHIDGNYKNNEPNNLLICTNSYHMSLHHKLKSVYGKNWREQFKKEE